MRVRTLLAPVLVGVFVWACSSSDPGTGSDPSGGSSSGGSGTSGGASSGGGSSSSGASSSSGGSSGASGGSSGASGSSGTGSSSGGSSSGGKDSGAKDTGAPDTGSSDPLAAARAACVDKINAYRASLTPALPPLQAYTAKEACTDGEAKSDSESGTPHGAFGRCGETAQDECPGWPGPPTTLILGCLAQMWAEGPGGGHYDNMTTTTRTKVSCGYYQTPKGDWWATQNFY